MQRDNKRKSTPSAPNRRDVLKTTSALSAAALFTTLGTNFAHAQGSDIIKVGVVGCGGRGTGAAGDTIAGAKIAGAQAEIYAIGDVFESQTRGMKDKYKLNNDQVYTGL